MFHTNDSPFIFQLNVMFAVLKILSVLLASGADMGDINEYR